MATGIVKGEQLSSDALLADNVQTEPFPLPDSRTTVTLNYPNKITDEQIFANNIHDYSITAIPETT